VRTVEISVRAQLCVERIDTRWRKKADHPDVFRAEMDEIIEQLGTVSSPGTPSPTARRPQLRRMLLEKAKCHVYFLIDEREQQIEVLYVWDARRERPPKL
jgi:plasmid stabilization system protein ParE